MPWNPWIEIEPNDTPQPAAQELYARTREHATGDVPDTVRLTSLTPAVAGLIHDLHHAIYVQAKGLSVREKEISALIVAAYNGCVH
jgi:hypothetical protein